MWVHVIVFGDPIAAFQTLGIASVLPLSFVTDFVEVTTPLVVLIIGVRH